MSSPVILVDGSNIGHAALQSGMRLSAGSIDTTAIFGFLQTIRRVKEAVAGDMQVLWDGRSWRHGVFEGYKASRDDRPELVEARERWVAARVWLARMLPHLGVGQIRAANMEADDLAARVSDHFAAAGRSATLVSADRDWLQLVGPHVAVLDPIRNRFVTLENFAEVTGLPTPYALAEAKAITGDKSDDIPGVGGMGEKTAEAILREFGGVDAFLARASREGRDRRQLLLLDDPKRQRRFRENLRLIWLRHPEAPASSGVTVVPGRLDPDAFGALCEELAFTSILRDPHWITPFSRQD